MAEQKLSAFELFKALGDFEAKLDLFEFSYKSSIIDEVVGDTHNRDIANKLIQKGKLSELDERFFRFICDLNCIYEETPFYDKVFINNAKVYIDERKAVNKIVDMLIKYDIKPVLNQADYNNTAGSYILKPDWNDTLNAPNVLIKRLQRQDLTLPAGLVTLLEKEFINKSNGKHFPEQEISYDKNRYCVKAVKLLSLIGVYEENSEHNSAIRSPLLSDNGMDHNGSKDGIFMNEPRCRSFLIDLYGIATQPKL